MTMTTHLHLYWLDKNWQKNGKSEARNVHLYVDMQSRVFGYSVNFGCNHGATSVEVVRKSDIDAYAKTLERMGFKKMDCK